MGPDHLYVIGAKEYLLLLYKCQQKWGMAESLLSESQISPFSRGLCQAKIHLSKRQYPEALATLSEMWNNFVER